METYINNNQENDFNLKLDKLKRALTVHYPQSAGVLDYFFETQTYLMIHDEYKENAAAFAFKNDFAELFDGMAKLAVKITNSDNKNSILAETLSHVLFNSILLTKYYLTDIKQAAVLDATDLRLVYFRKSLTDNIRALNNTLQKTGEYADDTSNLDKANALAQAADSMMENISPNSPSPEQRISDGITAMLGLLLGTALMMGGFFTALHFCVPLGVVAIGIGIVLTIAAFANIKRAGDDEEALAQRIHGPLKKISKPGFFNSQNPVVGPQVNEEKYPDTMGSKYNPGV